MVADLPLTVRVEFGRADVNVNDIMNWKPGTVVALDKLAGEQLHLYVNDVLVAEGEVVISNNHFALRLTDIFRKNKHLQKG